MDCSKEIVVFVNPRAGTGSGSFLIAELCRSLAGAEFQLQTIDSIDDLAPYLAAARPSIHAIVSVSGDGTVEAIINAARVDVLITVFPLGTENLLAKH